MLNREIPFLRIGLPLCAGIVSALYLKPQPVIICIAVLFSLSGLSIALIRDKSRSEPFFGIFFSSALYFCGMLLYTNERNSLTELKPVSSVFICELSDYPEDKPASMLFTVKMISMASAGASIPVKGSMIIYFRKEALSGTFVPGDKLIIRCTPVVITNRGNPYEFDYIFFMERSGIKYYSFTGPENILKHNSPGRRKLRHRALIIRERIIEMYRERGISEKMLPLVSAITLGEKSMLDQVQKQNFIKAGVMHIMAVSGLHAVILSLFVLNLLFFLKRRFNVLRIFLAILFLWFFAFITGLTPSVLRATLMFSFLQAGSLMHRRVNGINSVLASAFVLILARPSVIFDAGFLLSYSAVIFIIMFYNDLYNIIHFKNKIGDKIWQSAAITIVAQAGTLALTITLFNRFPVYFILTNVIIVPLSSLVVIGGCLLPAFYPVEFVSRLLATVVDRLTWLTELLTEKAAGLPFSGIENIGSTVQECILLFIFLLVLHAFFLKRPRIQFYYPASLLAVLVLAGTIRDGAVKSSGELIVYNSPVMTVGIRTGRILNIYSDTLMVHPEASRHAATLNLAIRQHVSSDGLFCIRAGSKKILICRNPPGIAGLNADVLVITARDPDMNAVKNIHAGEIILTSALAHGNEPQADTVHYIRRSGAYIAGI